MEAGHPPSRKQTVVSYHILLFPHELYERSNASIIISVFGVNRFGIGSHFERTQHFGASLASKSALPVEVILLADLSILAIRVCGKTGGIHVVVIVNSIRPLLEVRDICFSKIRYCHRLLGIIEVICLLPKRQSK